IEAHRHKNRPSAAPRGQHLPSLRAAISPLFEAWGLPQRHRILDDAQHHVRVWRTGLNMHAHAAHHIDGPHVVPFGPRDDPLELELAKPELDQALARLRGKPLAPPWTAEAIDQFDLRDAVALAIGGKTQLESTVAHKVRRASCHHGPLPAAVLAQLAHPE